MGSDGFVMSGAVTFDHRSTSGKNAYTAWSQEKDTLDPSNGHSDKDMQYHYHAVSYINFLKLLLKIRNVLRYQLCIRVLMIPLPVNT